MGLGRNSIIIPAFFWGGGGGVRITVNIIMVALLIHYIQLTLSFLLLLCVVLVFVRFYSVW